MLRASNSSFKRTPTAPLNSGVRSPGDIVRTWTLLTALFFPFACSAQNFCAYKNTNQLVWDKDFQQHVKQFFGSERDGLYWKNGLLSDQAIEGLGGPADDIRQLGPKLVMASACRAHSCMEKAAAIIACPSTVLAVGILHFSCSRSCSSDATVTLFFSDKNKTLQGRPELEAWGKRAAESEDKRFTYQLRTQSNKPLQPTAQPLPRPAGG